MTEGRGWMLRVSAAPCQKQCEGLHTHSKSLQADSSPPGLPQLWAVVQAAGLSRVFLVPRALGRPVVSYRILLHCRRPRAAGSPIHQPRPPGLSMFSAFLCSAHCASTSAPLFFRESAARFPFLDHTKTALEGDRPSDLQGRYRPVTAHDVPPLSDRCRPQ